LRRANLVELGNIRKIVRAHPQDVLAQLADMKGVLAEMTDKSRTPRCENATRHGEANFWIWSKNQ
jgi:predicted component of type VI protein secretion system